MIKNQAALTHARIISMQPPSPLSPQSGPGEVIYTGYFVDNPDHLHKLFPHNLKSGKDVKLFGHHVTIAFRPANGFEDIDIGESETLKIIGRITNEDLGVDVLLVDPGGLKTDNTYPHITLATLGNTLPVHANAAIKIAKRSGAVINYNVPIEIASTQGYFNGNTVITS